MDKNIFKLTHLKELCQQYNFSPSKQYGQNFLVNLGIVEKIVKAAELNMDDLVIEVGPGFGVLTFALAEQVNKVFAVEIERKLEKYWVENKPSNVEIIWGNALRKLPVISYQLSTDVSTKSPFIDHGSLITDHQSYKIIANLPYQITSQILRAILELPNKPSLIVVMVQKEVARRICAEPGEMSLLAVSVQYYGQPEIVDFVTKGNFWPAPKVDSAILRVRLLPPHPRAPLLGQERGDEEQFFKFARAGFAQKRKQLWRNLSEGLKLDKEKVKTVIREVMGDEKVRAEELVVEEWKRIIHSLD